MARFAIVCAMLEEFTTLQAKININKRENFGRQKVVIGDFGGESIVIIQAGVGNINASSATTHLIIEYNPEIMLFSGIAGSLKPNLKIGDTLIAKMSFLAEGRSHEQLRPSYEMPRLHNYGDPQLLERIKEVASSCPYPVSEGTIVSSDKYPAPEDFSNIAADAIDMETAAFYQVCNNHNKPCIAIRSFSNPVTNAEKEELKIDNVNFSAGNATDLCFRLIKDIIDHPIDLQGNHQIRARL